MIAAIAFVIGVIMGNATKAHLYGALFDYFFKMRRRREKEFECLIRAKNEEIERLTK